MFTQNSSTGDNYYTGGIIVTGFNDTSSFDGMVEVAFPSRRRLPNALMTKHKVDQMTTATAKAYPEAEKLVMCLETGHGWPLRLFYAFSGGWRPSSASAMISRQPDPRYLHVCHDYTEGVGRERQKVQ